MTNARKRRPTETEQFEPTPKRSKRGGGEQPDSQSQPQPDEFIPVIHDFKETNIFLDVKGDYASAFDFLKAAVMKACFKITVEDKNKCLLQLEIDAASQVEIQILAMPEDEGQICIDFNQLGECDLKTLFEVHKKVVECL